MVVPTTSWWVKHVLGEGRGSPPSTPYSASTPPGVDVRPAPISAKSAAVVAVPSCRAKARHPRLTVLIMAEDVGGGLAPTAAGGQQAPPCQRPCGLFGPSPSAQTATVGPDEPSHDDLKRNYACSRAISSSTLASSAFSSRRHFTRSP